MVSSTSSKWGGNEIFIDEIFIQQANSNEIIFEESQFNSKNANNQNWKELLQMTLMERERESFEVWWKPYKTSISIEGIADVNLQIHLKS